MSQNSTVDESTRSAKAERIARRYMQYLITPLEIDASEAAMQAWDAFSRLVDERIGQNSEEAGRALDNLQNDPQNGEYQDDFRRQMKECSLQDDGSLIDELTKALMALQAADTTLTARIQTSRITGNSEADILPNLTTPTYSGYSGGLDG